MSIETFNLNIVKQQIRHLSFNRYLTSAQLSDLLVDLVAAYPGFATLHRIGESHQGRTIWLLELTNPATGPAHEKPGYYIDANIHAEEISGTSVVVYTAWYLLSRYGIDPLPTRLLDQQVFYLVPRVNPDGAEIVQTLPYYEWIGNGRYLPGEEQFGPGLRYADINEDGYILDMRFPDSGGEWKASQQDERLMLPRTPDDVDGTFYRVVPEGLLVDWDGGDFSIPRPQDGNLNRNFPSNWVPESQQYGAGEHPLSEPEVAAIVRWILDHPNIAGMQCYHTHSGVILRPWLTFPDAHFVGNDKLLYELLGQMGVEETGYPLISVYEDFTPDKNLQRYGSSIDWSFGALGIPTFSTELWDVFSAAGIEREDYYPLRHFSEQDQHKLLCWQDEKLDGDGFMPWTPFDHPQLGAVEIGGWKRLFTFRNPPPSHYLEAMAEANCRFTLRHAASAPRLRLRNCRLSAIAGDVYEISVEVENIGFLPTNLSDQALAMNAATPVVVKLSGPETLHLLTDPATQELGHLAGRFSRNQSYSRFYDWPLSAKTARWTVRLPAESAVRLSVCAECPKAGTVRADLIIDSDRTIVFRPAVVPASEGDLSAL
ncbi:MAG: peptidase M14 [Chloroflexi bacterium]|nr:peptidase M14 [Chloroflexota bacterium]